MHGAARVKRKIAAASSALATLSRSGDGVPVQRPLVHPLAAPRGNPCARDGRQRAGGSRGGRGRTNQHL